MYRKGSQGWIKHYDFVLFDLFALQFAYLIAYFIRNGAGNPYGIPLYRNMAVAIELADIAVLFFFETLKNVLKRGYYRELAVTVKHVILWLAREQFESLDTLPDSLKRLKKYGLEIKFCDDLRPHKKYYYAMQEYPDAIVITVDDDVYYPSFLVERLYSKHKEFPDAICCNWAHLIKKSNDGKILPYNKWEKGVSGFDDKPSFSLNQVGYEGVLYPPHSLDSRCFDKDLLCKLSLNADDLWLKAMSYLHGTKVVRANDVAYRYFGILKSQKVALNTSNCGQNKNDEAIEKITTYFPELEDR